MDQYVPEYIASAVETAKCDPKRDLVPWAWFILGWFGPTLRAWRAFAASDRDMGGNELHRAVPASLGAIDTAVCILGDRIPAPVSAELRRLSIRLRQDHEDLARQRQGLPLLYDCSFESGGEATTEVFHQVLGIDPADGDERPWHEFGFNLGGWLHNHLFADRPLGGELAALIDTCRAVPDKFAITLPPVVNALRSLSPPATWTSEAAAELAILVKRHCQPEWGPTREASADTSCPPTRLTKGGRHPFARMLRNRRPVATSNDTTFQSCWLGEAIHALVERVEADLLTRTKRPVWKRTAKGGILKYDGEVVREVAGEKKASGVIAILDAFESQGWPEKITLFPTTSKGRAVSDKLHNPLKSLRKGLKRLYFGGDNTSSGVYWTVLPDTSS